MGPILRETKVSVWITKFRALTVQKLERFKQAGIKAINISKYSFFSGPDVRVIMVAPEQVGGHLYYSTLYSLYRRKKLQRIVVDKAHVPVFADSYRQSVARMACIRKYTPAVPVVLLKATAPPSLPKDIVQENGWELDRMRIVRGSCRRPSLALRVHSLRTAVRKLLSTKVKAVLHSHLWRDQSTRQRHILMCLTRGDAEQFYEIMASRLHSALPDVQFGLYHSGIVEADREMV